MYTSQYLLICEFVTHYSLVITTKIFVAFHNSDKVFYICIKNK